MDTVNNRRRVGVIADDITGSNDIGVMFAAQGFRVRVVSLIDSPVPEDFEGTDVLVVNTASRLDTAKEAARKNRWTACFFKQLDCRLIYTKTCSVFRGNIGAGFDAVQDALGVKSSMVVGAFPKNGRATVNGVHLLNGMPVAETHFANDPVTPLRHSRVDEIIGEQSARACRSFTLDMFDEAPEQKLEELKKEASYIIFDAVTQEDLKRVARLIKDEYNICGASAVCAELPEAWDEAGVPRTYRPDTQGPVAVFAGSLTPQTAAQVKLLEAGGIRRLILSAPRLLTDNERAEETARVLAGVTEGDVLIYASRDFDEVSARAVQLGLTHIEAGRRISLAFETLAKALLDRGYTRFVVAGGETSDAVSRGLGVRAMEIYDEIEPGVPLMTARASNGANCALVFKSGSFGSDAFLAKAMRIC